jgi:diketogulonate reductase-like aldo/keto reductase
MPVVYMIGSRTEQLMGAAMISTTTTTLNNGVRIPLVGFGVFQIPPGKKTYEAVRTALRLGYRAVDTAAAYKNEAGVGKAVEDSGIGRREIFVTTKVWISDHGYDKTLRAFEESKKKLRLDSIDLYLIHWPARAEFGETWRAMERLLGEGQVRAIGVSNFLIHHLETLLETAEITPAVNQIEFHPFNVQPALLEFCRNRKIQVEAWSPLGRGRFLDHPLIAEIARRHGRSPAQILIRWDLQHQVVTIPRSTQEAHIRENAEVFDFQLSTEEMGRLDALDEGKRTGPDPDTFVGDQ